MKKLALLCAMALVLAALCVPQVYAVNITIPDTTTDGTGVGWWGNVNEPQETEPQTQTGNVWDLKSFTQTGTTITMTGGYDFKNGLQGTTGGDLFIAKNALPFYGATVTPSTGSNNYLYNYAAIANFGNNTYSVYAINAGTGVVPNTNPAFYNFSNPWIVVLASGQPPVGGGVLAYNPVGSDFTLDYQGLLGQIQGFGVNDYAYLHYTYSCGNDFMMGNPLGSNVPLPPSVLLLGSGLLGLVGLGWRRKKTNV